MRCFVTAGPTWEPLDRVRRLTNFSTGRLGGELANRLVCAGHEVTLLLSETATWNLPLLALRLLRFSTTKSLASALQSLACPEPVAIFHAAAVSDFTGGAVLQRGPEGQLVPLEAGKFTTRGGSLLLELRPTPKILPELRAWYPAGRLVGWKYEVDGSTTDALARGTEQLQTARTDACVVNGPAYGVGYGLQIPGRAVQHCPSQNDLFDLLLALTKN